MNMAGEILYMLQEKNASNARAAKDKVDVASVSSLDLVSEEKVANSECEERNSETLKPKKLSVSVGTVSSVLGKEYARIRPPTSDNCEATKPLKLDSEDIPMSEIWNEKDPQSITKRDDAMQKDVENFIFQILGNGFQLDQTVIREVLGSCGYNVNESMDKLLDLPASAMERSDGVGGPVSGIESILGHQKVQTTDFTKEDRSAFTTRKERKAPKKTGNLLLQKEVLQALFYVPERVEEKRKTGPVRAVKKSQAFGKLVDEPFDITTTSPTIVSVETKVTEDGIDDENSYEGLRKAAREYWITMKEYYKASVEAFVKGDHVLANKLLEQGHFFNKRAAEAGEKAVEKLIEPRNEGMCIDLRHHKPSEALRLLRLHLSTLSGISTIQYLKLIVGNNEEDPKGTRKRRVTQELEKESIKWTEEQSGQTLVIQVDELEPKQLSFTKRK